MSILLAEYNKGDTDYYYISQYPDKTCSGYIEGVATPGYPTSVILKISLDDTLTNASGNLNVELWKPEQILGSGSIPVSAIGEEGGLPSLISVNIAPSPYIKAWDWLKLYAYVENDHTLVMWRSEVSIGQSGIWQVWGETDDPNLPGKPINPTPSNVATGVKLGLTKLTWESGS